MSLGAIAISNFLRQNSPSPLVFGWLLLLSLSFTKGARPPGADSALEAVEDVLVIWGRTIRPGPSDRQRLHRLGCQFQEYCEAAARLWHRSLHRDVLAS